jgi:hypothetical protein
MKGMLTVAIGATLVFARIGLATPPGPGQHFDCTDGGDSSCATDDTGCVSNQKGHLGCSSKIGKAFAKAVKSVITCHSKQATMRFKGSSENGAGTAEENCEENPGNSAKGKLDGALTKLAASGICDPVQLSNAAAEEAVLFGAGPGSLDGQNGDVFCDSASGALIGDDDSGSVPNSADNLKCSITVGKMVAKLVAFAAKCHDKMNKSFFKAVDFDEELCEETNPVSHAGALDKYNQQRDKLATLGICPPCLDSTHLDALSASVLGQVETANQLVYPCNLFP